MDRATRRQEGPIAVEHERALGFVQAVGDVLRAPEALRLGDSGICGFTLSSGAAVVFIYYEKTLSLLCQLGIEMAAVIDRFDCYREILQRSFHANPDRDGVACVSADGDQLLVHWRLPVDQHLPHAEVFVERLLRMNDYWGRFLRERSRP